MKKERVVPWSKAQISDMSHEDLASCFSEKELRAISGLVRLGLGPSATPRQSDESIAQYRVRKRAAKEVYDQEFGTALREALEENLYEHKDQKTARLVAEFEAGIDPEEIKAIAERNAAHDARMAQNELETGGFSPLPKAMEVDDEGRGKG